MQKRDAEVNQETIAKHLGFSIATVSRSLANHPAISPETRRKVTEAARHLGYTRVGRSQAAHARDGRATTVGVLVGLQPNSSPLATFPFILQGIHERAKIENVTVEVEYVDPGQLDPDSRQSSAMKRMRESRWKGVILVYAFPPTVVAALAKKLPVVATLEDYEDLPIDCIDTNHHTGIISLVSQLVGAGHRRIGFVAWSYPTGGHWMTQRFGAYTAGVFARGLEFKQSWVLNAHKAAPVFSPEQIADEVARLVRKESVSAWVCAADHQAYQLMLGLTARGVAVPEDCSITGFDGIEPPLSLKPVCSRRVPSEAIGSAALVRLLNRMDHPKAHQRKILVETEFIAGATIAPAKRTKRTATG